MSRTLRERPIDFSTNDVVASCDRCSARIPMTSEHFDNYEHVVACPGCTARLPHHERTLTIATPADPMLAIDAVPTAAWYHASKYQQWPPDVAATRERAIHLGTYESAVDTMHWRMENMDEADVPFYLHRVALHPTDATIDPEVHADEGGMLTGFVPLEVVTRGGATVRRYINGAEHRGSISLAVDLDAIDSVQTIAIPACALADPATPAAIAAEARCIAEHADARDDHAASAAHLAAHPEPPDPNPLRQRINEMLGNSGARKLDFTRDVRMREADSRLDEVLAAEYLSTGVSTERQAALAQALRRRPGVDHATRHRLYREHAALLTHPEQVVTALASSASYRTAALSR